MKSQLYQRQLFSNLKGKGQNVTIVGRLIKVTPEEKKIFVEFDPQNKSTATVIVPELIDIEQFNKIVFIEVRGKCTNPRIVQMEEFTNFMENFDLKSYNQMLNYALKDFRQLFG